MQRIPWYERDRFWALLQPVLFNDAREAIATVEVQGFLDLCGLSPPARVLDLGCGPGRHSLELARRGFQVTGLDRTRSYLEQLRARAATEGLEVATLQGDMRELDQEGAFDAALCAFTTFGYFDDPADDLRVLQSLRRAVVPGGCVLIDVLGKEIAARGGHTRWWARLEPDVWLLEERQAEDSYTSLVTRWIVLRRGVEEQLEMRYRLYAASELMALLQRAGFHDVRVFGDWSGAPYGQDAHRLIVCGR